MYTYKRFLVFAKVFTKVRAASHQSVTSTQTFCISFDEFSGQLGRIIIHRCPSGSIIPSAIDYPFLRGRFAKPYSISLMNTSKSLAPGANRLIKNATALERVFAKHGFDERLIYNVYLKQLRRSLKTFVLPAVSPRASLQLKYSPRGKQRSRLTEFLPKSFP